MKIVRINRNRLIDLGVKEVYPKILTILKDVQQQREMWERVAQVYEEYQVITDPSTQTLAELQKKLRKFEAKKEFQQIFHLIDLATGRNSGRFDHDTSVPRLQTKIDQMTREGWDLISVVPIYVPHQIDQGGANELIALDYYFKI